MSSIKDRIALFSNKKKDDAPSPSSSSGSASTSVPSAPTRRASVADRIAALRNVSLPNENEPSSSQSPALVSTSQPVRAMRNPVEVEQPSTTVPETFCAPILDEIAPEPVVQKIVESESVCQAANVTPFQSLSPVSSDISDTLPASQVIGEEISQQAPVPVPVSRPSKRMSIHERLSMMKVQNDSPASVMPPAPESQRKTLIDDKFGDHKPIHKPSEVDHYISPTKVIASASTTSVTETPVEPEVSCQLLCAEDTPSEASLPTPPLPDVDVAIPAPAAEAVENPAATEAPAVVKIVATTDAPQVIDTQPAPAPNSIAARIAAMKAQQTSSSSISKPAPVSEEVASTASSGKISNKVKALGVGIILPGMGGPRPMLGLKPKPAEETEEQESSLGAATAAAAGSKVTVASTTDDGQFQHLNLQRPRIASSKRKSTSSGLGRKSWNDENP